MTRWPRLGIATAIALAGAALALSAPAWAEDDCKQCDFLPCLTFAIGSAERMQDTYRTLASQGRRLTQQAYEEKVNERKAEIAKLRAEFEAGNRQCELKLPDFDKRKPSELAADVEYRQWLRLGWGLKEIPAAQGGGVALNVHVETDMDKCEINKAQMDKYATIVACSGLAEATRRHEGTHVKQCEARTRRGRPGKGASLAEAARDEADAYAAEASFLESLRQVAEQDCKSRKSGAGLLEKAKEAADRLNQAIPLLTAAKKKGGR